MGRRLTLSQVGIKSPLDVANPAAATDEPATNVPPAPDAAEPQPRTTQRRSLRPAADPPPRARRRSPGRRPEARDAAGSVDSARFFGAGRPLQTSIALDDDYAKLLEQLARAASVSVNPLAIAALHAGLPADTETAREAIIDERVRRIGASPTRIERNLRLPEHLRARIDELVAGVRERAPRISRADLINAALRRGLPDNAEAAGKLVADYKRRLEQSV